MSHVNRRVVVSFAAAWLLFAIQASAQSDGRFLGAVRDHSGVAVPGASVIVKNERTGEERTVRAGDDGHYVVPNLKPSSYAVRAASGQLTPVSFTGLQLVAGQEFSLDVTFEAEGVDMVLVMGRTNVVDLSSARIGVNVGEREVRDLPVNGRQMSQLMLQTPGSQNAGTGTWQDVRFSGRAVEQNAIRYDGIEGSAVIDAAPGNLNGEIASPFKLQASLENVQEFRVESNNYPAEFGTGTGGQVSVITKSGSSQAHGSLFEYVRSAKFDSPNYFEKAAGLPASPLDQHQFGGSFGGPLVAGRAFFFGSYEAYRLKAGLNFVEAVPSAAAWSRATPAIATLRPAFLAPGAVILSGASANPDFDLAQLQGVQDVRENAVSGRVDIVVNSAWTSFVRVLHDQGTNLQPEGVTGRSVRISDNPTNAVFTLQGMLSDRTTNQFKLGYNAAPTRINGIAPTVNGIDLSNLAFNLSGSVANTGVAGQGASSGIAIPGGLVRANSATNGRAQPYDPHSLSLVDSLSTAMGSHVVKVGGEMRAIRMTTDRLGGITYTFPNVTAFLANQASSVQYLGDVSAPSPFNDGATGARHTRQEYYIAYGQDEWRLTPTATLSYGVRYDYYTPLLEADNRIVKFNIDTGVIDPNTTPLYRSSRTNVQPRVGLSQAVGKTVVRTGFGLFVGPGQTEDQIQPIESDRISSTLTAGAFPIEPAVLVANFVNNPANRSYQPRAYANDYSIPERVYQYTASIQRELPDSFTGTVAYVGSQGRNLFLRSIANRITQVVTNPDPTRAAFVVREFSIVQRDASGAIVGVQNPFAEVDYKTSGGHDRYNALLLSLSRRSAAGLAVNAQYTLGSSRGNTAGSNEALTSGNNARALDQFAYDDGYNNFDVRHAFNVSMLYPLPFGRGRRFGSNSGGAVGALIGNWNVGGIVNARSGLPVDIRIVRPDVVYRDAAGNIFANPAADRVAMINTPGGGASRNVRRPDLVPGADPYVRNGGLVFLNPAAFATPAPGTFGNLERNAIHGPSFRQADFFLAKHVATGSTSTVELRLEVFNVFDTVNFTNPVGTLPQAIPSGSLSEANRIQPGQPYTAAAAGTFGRLTSTVGRTVGLGTSRQLQFALRFQF